MTERIICPNCNSKKLRGLVLAFWVDLDEEGDADLMSVSLDSESEVGPKRLCIDCNFEFEEE